MFEVVVVINDKTLTINCQEKNIEALNNQVFTYSSIDGEYYIFTNATYGEIKVELSGTNVIYVTYQTVELDGGNSGEFVKQN